MGNRDRESVILRGKSHFAGDPYAPVVNEKDIDILERNLEIDCHSVRYAKMSRNRE
jgi:hypothetical protein